MKYALFVLTQINTTTDGPIDVLVPVYVDGIQIETFNRTKDAEARARRLTKTTGQQIFILSYKTRRN